MKVVNISCLDQCGVINGDNSSCSDECGVPNGDNSSCTDEWYNKWR